MRIRIFTPARELPFAGHPTLGAAFVLGGPLSKIVVRLETGSGVVPVELERDGARIVFGRMEQPIPTWEAVEDPAPIFAALGVAGSGLPVERYDLGPGHLYIELGSAPEVAALEPDIGALARATQDGVNCFARDGARWKSRMFAPNHGVAEDPATGSAAGPLAIHLARHGRIAFGERIEISQGAEIGRPSTLYAEAHGSERRDRAGRRRRLGGDRRARRVQPLSSIASISGSSAGTRSRTRRRRARGRAGCARRRRRRRGRRRRSRSPGPAADRAPTRATSSRRRARRGAAASRRRRR